MQFRKQANRIQVLAYDGYDSTTKRGKYKLLGSFDRFTLRLDDELMSKLSDEQKKEVRDWVESKRSDIQEAGRVANLHAIAANLAKAAATLDESEGEDFTAAQAEALWASMDEMRRVLGRAGYPRTMFKKTAQAKTEAVLDTRTRSLFGGDV